MTIDEAMFVRGQAKQLKVDYLFKVYNTVFGTDWAVYIKREQFIYFDDAIKNIYGGQTMNGKITKAKKIRMRNGSEVEYSYKKNGVYYCTSGLSIGEKIVDKINYGNGWQDRY